MFVPFAYVVRYFKADDTQIAAIFGDLQKGETYKWAGVGTFSGLAVISLGLTIYNLIKRNRVKN
jgi:hypothetical protein